MFIKQLVLDGFKSYATRTVVTGWDQMFNAITGLNGSGKSNILDSICFVLGITRMDRVRVQSLKQLIYKEGQARVTKASVTIVFDNRDKENSPVGYQDCPEITVTRTIAVNNRSKYMINGQTAQVNRVRDLFHSVSLDVNNPHFLIMQGMITRVLNHGAKDVKGMIEEAAGTKMYMEKKHQAESIMKKKEAKMKQITNILDEEIQPELDKLRKEKKQYNEWKKNDNVIGRLERLVVAYDFFIRNSQLVKDQAQVAALQQAAEDALQQITFLDTELERKDTEIATLKQKVENESKGKLQKLEDERNRVSKLLATTETNFSSYVEEVKSHEKKREKHVKKLDQTKASHTASIETLEKLKTEQKGFTTEMAETRENIKKLESQKLGISTGEDDKGSIEQQLMDADRHRTEEKGKLDRLNKAIPQMQKKIATMERSAKKADKQFTKMQEDLNRKEHQKRMIEDELKNLGYDPSQNQVQSSAIQENEKLGEQLYQLKDRKNEIFHQLIRRTTFRMGSQYRKPSPQFSEKDVFGRIITMIKVPDPKFRTAIQEIAGGHLFSVVVRNSNVASAILKKGALKSRTTFLPLDKIRPRRLQDSRIQRAKQIGLSENVQLAADVVEYPPELKNVVEFLFGSTLICRDNQICQRVFNDNGVKATCVSLEGDQYKCTGEVMGGSSNRSAPQYISVYAEYGEIEAKMRQMEAEFGEKQKVIEAARKKQETFENLNDRLQSTISQLARLQDRMKDSEFAQKQAEIDQLKKEVEESIKTHGETKEVYKKFAEECKKLKRTMENFKKEKERMMREVDQQIKADKKKLKQYLNKEKKEKQRLNKAEAEVAELVEEMSEQEKEITELDTEFAEKKKAGATFEAELQKQRDELAEATAIEKREKDALAAENTKINALKEDQRKLESQKRKAQGEADRHQKNVDRARGDLSELENFVNHLLQNHRWINEEQEHFGKANTPFDFSGSDMGKKKSELEKLKQSQQNLGKRINKKVMGMLERAETEYSELMKKRRTVEQDKKKIFSVIKELDRKKTSTLMETFEKVNKDFGKIFSELLHGSTSKLVFKDGDIENGVEIKVCFGEVWKESLSELSGGQKSLLALSLILALLLYKPAPMYILDEIDAALDPSHTQNIGSMLARNFKKSQFIVVSLKEGMFNNANVLFRTKFVEGVSTVRKVKG